MEEAGHRQVEHTADVALELWGPDHAALLEQGALGVVELLTGGASVPATQERLVDLDVVDAADGLVRFLNEVLWLAQVEGFMVASATFDLGDPARLRARLQGSEVPLVEEIKSVTYHDLAIERVGARLRATVVLDV